MATGFTIELEGGGHLQLKLREWEVVKRTQIAALIVAICLAIERTAKLEVRVDTGRLRAAIRADVRAALQDLVGMVHAGTDYAAFVEFGTARMAAHPFMLPAWEAHRRDFYDGLVAILSSRTL